MNNKDANQTEQMRRLVCAFVVRKPLKAGFLILRPIYNRTPDTVDFLPYSRSSINPFHSDGFSHPFLIE